MAIVVNKFTPSTTVEETDTIASTDDKFRTIINEAGDYVETETQSVANQLEDRVDVKINELESAVDIKILQLASVDDSTYTADYIDTQNKALYQKSGYTTDTLPEDRWLETATPNVIVDKVGDRYVIDGVVYEKTTTKQATLPLAPFAPTSTDELLDVYTDGIKTNTPHSKGDIVVCNQFKDLISDGSTIIQSVSISPSSPFNSTVTFNISDPSFSEISNKLIYMEWKDVNGAVYNTTLTLTGTQILINTTAQFDEITSLRRTVANYTGDTIYQCIADAPTDTEVTNTSYFQTLDFVSRLDVVYLSATGYGSFKGYKTFTDKEIVEGGSDIIASKYSDRFSKIGDNLYLLDGTTKVTNLQVTGSRLNSKYYHPVFNQFGSYKNSSNQFWYSDTTPATSIYEAIAKSVNTTSGRPDGKYADRVYLKNYNGLAPHSTFYAKDSEFGSDRGLTGLSTFEDKLFFGEYLIAETITTASSTLKTLTLGKAKSVKQVLYSTDSGTTWATQTFTFNSINNQITLGTARDYILVSYVAWATPYTQIDPVKITKVEPKVIASNSHSVYKGGLVVQDATGKVSVGNGSNGYESRVLENAEIGYDYPSSLSETVGSYLIKTGDKIFVDVLTTGIGVIGAVYERIGVADLTDLRIVNYTYEPGFRLVANIKTIPSHSTLALDSSNSPAAKWFKAECVFSDGGKGECVFSEEMIYDVGFGDDDTFEQLTNGTLTDLNGNTVITKVLGRRY